MLKDGELITYKSSRKVKRKAVRIIITKFINKHKIKRNKL